MTVTSSLAVVADCSLSIQIIHDRHVARLVPIGELDVHSASTFSIAGELAVGERPEHLQIDLSQVTFLDSSGVRGIDALIAVAQRAGVPCTVVGRERGADDVGAANAPAANEPVPVANAPIVVWSGSTKHVIALPET